MNRLVNTKCCDIKLAKTCMLVRNVNSTALKEKERAKGIIINGQRLNFMTGGKDKIGDSMYHYGVDQMFSGKAEAFILEKVDGTISAKYNVYPSVDTMTHNSTEEPREPRGAQMEEQTEMESLVRSPRWREVPWERATPTPPNHH